MSDIQRSLAVDASELLDQAAIAGRHQQSWQLLIEGRAPAVAAEHFGDGLTQQAARIAAVLGQLHQKRIHHASRIQHDAQLTGRFARQVDTADEAGAGMFGQVLP